MQKYYMREMKGRIKKGGYKNGRGYCGWYTNLDGKKMFLRSAKEFMYAKYLDKEKKHFLTECSIFVIKGTSYKPDFFIYADAEYKELVKIVEVKDNKKDAEPYFQYSFFFNNIGVKFEVEYNVSKMKKFVTKEELKKWVSCFVEDYAGVSMSGKDNPMFGMRHSKETKRKIGEQTRLYMSDPDVKEKHSNSIKSFWKSDKALRIKKKYRRLRGEEKRVRDLEKNKKDPFEKRKCVVCGMSFSCRKSENRKTCKSRKGCSVKLAWDTGKLTSHPNGKKSYANKLVKSAKRAGINSADSFEDFSKKILLAKEKNIIPKNFSMYKHVIEKYFGSFENMKGKIKNE